jgi:hypothetical protein
LADAGEGVAMRGLLLLLLLLLRGFKNRAMGFTLAR